MYNYIGTLKPKKWFLENGWFETSKGIESNGNFVIYTEELNSELILKEITDYYFKLELEDENGTQYKTEWFEELKEIE